MRLFFLIALLNNDEKLKVIVEKNKNLESLDLIDAVGGGRGLSPFVIDEEIQYLFGHPWIRDKKQAFITLIEQHIEYFKDQNTYTPFLICTDNQERHFKRVVAIVKAIKSSKYEKERIKKDEEKLTLPGLMRSFCFVVILFLFCRYVAR